jgi:hypothetical protein
MAIVNSGSLVRWFWAGSCVLRTENSGNDSAATGLEERSCNLTHRKSRGRGRGAALGVWHSAFGGEFPALGFAIFLRNFEYGFAKGLIAKCQLLLLKLEINLCA